MENVFHWLIHLKICQNEFFLQEKEFLIQSCLFFQSKRKPLFKLASVPLWEKFSFAFECSRKFCYWKEFFLPLKILSFSSFQWKMFSFWERKINSLSFEENFQYNKKCVSFYNVDFPTIYRITKKKVYNT